MNHTPKNAAHNWSAEPWQRAYGRPKAMTISLEDYDRAVDCVNALAGIEDPAANLKGIYSALVEIARLGVDVQFCPEDQRGFHARRIRQIAGVAAKSLGEIYYNPNPVQEIALSPNSQEELTETARQIRAIRTIAEHQFTEGTHISNAAALRMIQNVANMALKDMGVQEPALPTEQL
jgi:hypothetical protein